MSENTSETAPAIRDRFDDEDLKNVQTFEDATRLLNEAGSVITDYSEEYGSGFSVLPTDEKSRLIKVPFVIIEWRFSEGDSGEFVSALIMTDKAEKLVLNDGSTGICDQLRKVTQHNLDKGMSEAQAQRGLVVRGGLRVSEYDYTDDKGKTSKARTYYLAN